MPRIPVFSTVQFCAIFHVMIQCDDRTKKRLSSMPRKLSASVASLNIYYYKLIGCGSIGGGGVSKLKRYW